MLKRRWIQIAALMPLVQALTCAPVSAAPPALDATLPVDPSVKMGKLPNGLSYWIRPNKTPAGKVSVWMHVGVGSLAEQPGQRGLAHFLEHMGFNGSKHFPAGTLVKYFESLGMTFGNDQNAFTSFDQTTYQLTLPDAKRATIDKGLRCLADQAHRLLLTPAEIDKERGVVLEEFRMSKGWGKRLLDKRLPILFPGSRIADRLPIGTEEDVTALKREAFVAFAREHYRPDATTVIIVGDVDEATAARAVKTAFGDWRAPVGGEQPAAGVRPSEGPARVAVLTDPEVPFAQVGLQTIAALRKQRTVADLRLRMLDGVASWMLSRRLDDLVRAGKAPFQGAGAGVHDFVNAASISGVSAVTQPDRWAATLDVLVVEVERARQHGFNADELDAARRAALADAERNAQQEPTVESRALVAALNEAVTEKRTPLSAAQRLELAQALLPGIGVDEVNAAFRARFGTSTGLVELVLPAKAGVKVPTESDLLAALAKARAKPVTAPARAARITRLLDNEPQPGREVERQDDATTKVVSVTYANGVRAHVRSMDYERDAIVAQVTLAGGGLRETAQNRGVSQAAGLAFSMAATATLSSTQIRDYMTGRKTNVTGYGGFDSLVLNVGGVRQDVQEGFRLAHLLLKQARVEPAALSVWRDGTKQQFEQKRTSVEAQLFERVGTFLAKDDARVRWVTPDDAAKIDDKAANAWLDQHLRQAPIEVAIVGDATVEQLLGWAARYFGSLPARKRIDASLDPLREVPPIAGPAQEQIVIETITPRASLELGWMGPGYLDRRDREVIDVAAKLLSSKLLEEVREKQSLVYGLSFFQAPTTSLAGRRRLATSMSLAPENGDKAAALAQQVILKFAKEGPTDKELATVRAQLANEIETTQKRPAYWMSALSSLDFRGRKLEDESGRLARMVSYSREDVKEVLGRYVRDQGRYTIVARPKASQQVAVPSKEPMPGKAPIRSRAVPAGAKR